MPMILVAYFLWCGKTCDIFTYEVKSGQMDDCKAALAQKPNLALGCFWIRERDRWIVFGKGA